MIADLYICSGTFAHNGTDSVADVRVKLSHFQTMLERVSEFNDENKLHVIKQDFNNTDIFGDGKTLNDILSGYENCVNSYGKDVYTLLQGVLKHCIDCRASLEDMKAYLELENEHNCSAILVLNPLEGYEKHMQVISNVDGWLCFRRHYLAKYPGTPDFFLKEAKKYFRDTCIHEDTASSLRDVLKTHPCQIVKYLSVLNDNFIVDFKKFGCQDMNSFLPRFASTYGLDDASFDGRKDDKFNFVFSNGLKAYCEAHLKMYKDDARNKNKHCRIYFKKPSSSETTMYVGRICKHL